MPDPEAQEPSKPTSDLEATVPLRVARDPYSTQPLNLAQHPNVTAALHPAQGEPTLRLKPADLPGEREVQLQAPGPRQMRSASFRVWLALALGALVVAGGVYLGFFRGARKDTQAPSGSSEAVPPGAQAYLAQAKAGDVHAMRMLGAMYYNGLDVPQDREKGLYWYRKAAEAGSEAARAELAKLEGGR